MMVVIMMFHHVECIRFIDIAKSDPSDSQLEELVHFLSVCSFLFRNLSKSTIQTLNELEDIIQSLCLSTNIVCFHYFYHSQVRLTFE